MKKNSLLQRIRIMVRIALHYTRQHSMSLAAINELYAREWADPRQPGQQLSCILRITPDGSFYKVSQTTYQNGEVLKEDTWLATYGWHSNGHLIEIGGYRYCIFNPLGNSLSTEDCSDEGIKTVEVYTLK